MSALPRAGILAGLGLGQPVQLRKLKGWVISGTCKCWMDRTCVNSACALERSLSAAQTGVRSRFSNLLMSVFWASVHKEQHKRAKEPTCGAVAELSTLCSPSDRRKRVHAAPQAPLVQLRLLLAPAVDIEVWRDGRGATAERARWMGR